MALISKSNKVRTRRTNPLPQIAWEFRKTKMLNYKLQNIFFVFFYTQQDVLNLTLFTQGPISDDQERVCGGGQTS